MKLTTLLTHLTGGRLPCRPSAWFHGLLLTVLLAALPTPAATRYQAGDLIEEFTLTDRSTRQPVKLGDLEGKIVFLEWFAWWCPFCQASAPQVESGIVQWYGERGGNPAGIEVVHVAVNLQAGQETQTGNFVNRAGFELVLEDFNRALANRFQSGGQPIFAIINGVTNSPSHRPWQLLLHQDGYGQRDFTASIADFRRVIDAVQAPAAPAPPRIASGLSDLTIVERSVLRLEVVADGAGPLTYEWRRNGQVVAGVGGPVLEIASASFADAGSYEVRVGNGGGEVVSGPVMVVVQPRPVPVPGILVPVRNGDGQWHLPLVGVGGVRSVLETTSDLRSWRMVQELDVTVANQQIAFDPAAAEHAWFRVRNE